MKRRLIVFVCTGNICRSPMAEYLFRAACEPDTLWEAASAGVAAGYGNSASQAGVDCLLEIGIDMSGHRSQPLTEALARDATLLVAMTADHKQMIVRLYPFAAQKTFLFYSFANQVDRDVPDPIGFPVTTYRRLREELSAVIPEIVVFANQLHV